MIELINIGKIYRRGSEQVSALKDINLTITKGEFLSIIGQSGSGKTTLLNIIGCMDSPTKGIIKINGKEINIHSEKDMTILRRKIFGFVFQQFYLMPGLTVLENIMLPLLFSGKKADKGHLEHIIGIVGLTDKKSNLPSQLSGGEMQRVAIARALTNNPDCILADEPTGNLDTANSDKIFDLLKKLNKDGQTIIMVTHNNELANKTDRTITIKDGELLKSPCMTS